MAQTTENKNEEKKTWYRYFCEACTGRAFYAKSKHSFGSKTCQNCSANVEYDEGNWFEVTDESELKKLK